ncbi:MAG TPA: HD domain-containing phosphohydrolase [Gemmatimonadota bacterium]|nr:HD domain-containing phosphohydrolase [Gemmatimonadota bacterium]
MSPESGSGPAAAFLTALWRHLSAAGLYRAGHPHRREMGDEVHRTLLRLLAGDPSPTFSLLDDEVIYGRTPLRELKAGGWAARLERAGVSRIEVVRSPDREEITEFLDGLTRRLRGADGPEAGADPDIVQLGHIRYGPLGLLDRDGPGGRPEGLGEVGVGEEADTVGWLHGEAARRGEVPVAETLAVVNSLSVAMHGARRILSPFLKIKETDQYTAGHCVNVSILSMSLAEEVGLSAAVVRAVGAAGLLHDIGKVAVPEEILNKPGRLTDEERRIVESHPVEGCRMLLASGEEMALPAMIAYEHHMGAGGGGYPAPRFSREPLRVSRLVQVCDFYDALRTRRRYRAPLPPEQVIRILHENAATKLDAELTNAFIEMIRRWDPATLLSEERGNGAGEHADVGERAGGEAGAGAGDDAQAGADAELAY